MRIAPKRRQVRVTLPLQSMLDEFASGDTIKVAWVANLFRKKLEQQGIRISERDFDTITQEVRTRFAERAEADWNTGWQLDIEHEGEIKLEFGEEDLQGFSEFLNQRMSSVVQDTVTELTPHMLATVLHGIDDESEARSRKSDEFRNRLVSRWRKPLKLLGAQIALATKYGEDMNAWLRDRPPEGKDAVIEAVTRLQARATQVAWEVEVLLQNGFADGALSRWRTLHEVSIVALFIEQEGEDTARRYLDHLQVDSRDMARFMRRAGRVDLTDDELKELEAEVDALCKEHGEEFDGYYGWASKAIQARRRALGLTDRKKINPNFFDIEEAVDMDRLRPYYKLASGGVHAGPKGAFYKLGLLPRYASAILAGPSNAGLSESGRLTAWSLSMTCAALMMVEPMLDGMIWGSVITELGSLAGDAFLVAERNLHEEERELPRPGRSFAPGAGRPRLRLAEKPSARQRRRLRK